MAKSKRIPKDERVKHEIIAADLRSEIVAGKLRPGARLPGRRELLKQYGVSIATLQKGFERLQQDGFIRADGRNGTFVADRPPHQHQYALVFPNRSGGEAWSRFSTAILNAANEISNGDCRIRVYHDVRDDGDAEEMQRLRDDIDGRVFAGIIYHFAIPGQLNQLAPFADCRLPRVSIMSSPQPGWAAVYPDSLDFIDRCIACLAAQRRKRIAVITTAGNFHAGFRERLQAGFAEHKMVTYPFWNLELAMEPATAVQNAVELLFNLNQPMRPDGLIILDDNLVENACAGLVAAGIRVPRDLDVTGLCNFPWSAGSVLPIQRIGFDTLALLRRCIEVCRRQADGAAAETSTRLPAVTEEEFDRRNQSPVAAAL